MINISKITLIQIVSSLIAGLFVAFTATAADLTLDAGYRFDENLTRAEAASDQEHDHALVFGAHASQLWRLDALTLLTLEGGINGTWWTRFEDVSQFAIEAGVRIRRRWGLGFTAPWLELSSNLIGLQHLDSDIRDGGLWRNGLTAGKRFGSRLSSRLGYNYQIRRASEGKVFDLERHEVFGQLDFNLTPRWLIYAEVGAIEGELTSTASLPNQRIRSKANVVPQGFDEAFGRGQSPLGIGLRPRWTYQIDGVVVSGEVGVNYPLKPGLAIDVAARYVQAYAAGDNQYNGVLVNAGILWQFD